MSKWIHVLCASCYSVFQPLRTPALLKDEQVTQACCGCGSMTDKPIYYRADPQSMRCKGVHD